MNQSTDGRVEPSIVLNIVYGTSVEHIRRKCISLSTLSDAQHFYHHAGEAILKLHPRKTVQPITVFFLGPRGLWVNKYHAAHLDISVSQPNPPQNDFSSRAPILRMVQSLFPWKAAPRHVQKGRNTETCLAAILESLWHHATKPPVQPGRPGPHPYGAIWEICTSPSWFTELPAVPSDEQSAICLINLNGNLRAGSRWPLGTARGTGGETTTSGSFVPDRPTKPGSNLAGEVQTRRGYQRHERKTQTRPDVLELVTTRWKAKGLYKMPRLIVIQKI